MRTKALASSTPLENFRLVGEFFELALRHKRQQLRARQPELPEAEIDSQVEAWLRERRGAENGDGEGRAIEWPRRKN